MQRGVVQWQDTWFMSTKRGFDSHRRKSLFFLVLLMVVSVFIGCTPPWEDIYLTETTELTTWVYENIAYVPESVSGVTGWQTPRQTLRLGTGDCEDGAILLMKLFNENIGIEPEFMIVRHPGEDSGHAAVLYDGLVYEWTGGFIKEYEVYLFEHNFILERTLPYGEVMYKAVIFTEETR